MFELDLGTARIFSAAMVTFTSLSVLVLSPKEDGRVLRTWLAATNLLAIGLWANALLDTIPLALSVLIAHVGAVGAAGLVWSSVEIFRGRPAKLGIIGAAAFLDSAFAAAHEFLDSAFDITTVAARDARSVSLSIALAAFAALAIASLARASVRPQLRRATVLLIVIQALHLCYMLVRIAQTILHGWPMSESWAVAQHLDILFATIGTTYGIFALVSGDRLLRLADSRGEILALNKVIVDAKNYQSRIIDNLFEAVITIDERGTVLSFNHAAELYFGYTASEVLGRGVEMLMPQPHAAQHARFLGDYLITGDAKVIGAGREVPGRRKDGSHIPLDLAVTEIRLPDGRRHFIGTLRDLTERNRVRAKLTRAKQMAAIGQLSAAVAHEFNNRLGIILGNLGLLRRRLPAGDAPAEEMVADSIRAAEAATALTGRLLAFAGLDDGIPVARLGVGAAVTAFLETHRGSFGPAIRIEPRFGPGLWPVQVQPPRFEDTLDALTHNAAESMPGGGTIAIAIQNVQLHALQAAALEVPAGDYVKLTVADQGVGMSQDQIDRVFDPFFTTKKFGRNAGLSLGIIASFARRLGGALHIESATGHGTQVHLYLPRYDERPASSSRNLVLNGAMTP